MSRTRRDRRRSSSRTEILFGLLGAAAAWIVWQIRHRDEHPTRPDPDTPSQAATDRPADTRETSTA